MDIQNSTQLKKQHFFNVSKLGKVTVKALTYLLIPFVVLAFAINNAKTFEKLASYVGLSSELFAFLILSLFIVGSVTLVFMRMARKIVLLERTISHSNYKMDKLLLNLDDNFVAPLNSVRQMLDLTINDDEVPTYPKRHLQRGKETILQIEDNIYECIKSSNSGFVQKSSDFTMDSVLKKFKSDLDNRILER